MHLRASDELDPDHLRALARPNVTLWLSTKTNVLRASTIENLNRFDAAFVSMKPPITQWQTQALEKAPRAGIWLDVAALEGRGLARILGPRPLALKLQGDLDETLASRIAAARPELIEWTAPSTIDVLSWSLFRALPGKKLLLIEAAATACEQRSDREPASRVHVAALLALGSAAFPCGRGPRVIVEPDTDRWLLQSMLLRDPTIELEVDVGSNEVAAQNVRRLFDDLGLGPMR